MMLSLEQTSFRQEMVSKGYKQALKFTWEATCKKTMDFYQVLASDSRRDTQV